MYTVLDIHPVPLARGSTGAWVRDLQQFLNRQGAALRVDGELGPQTEAAVRHLQQRHGLSPTGVVNNATWTYLGRLGFVPEAVVSPSVWFAPAPPPWYPPTPDFACLDDADRRRAFGTLRWNTGGSDSGTFMPDAAWSAAYLTWAEIPQLRALGVPDGRVRCHRRVRARLETLWHAWEDEGLLALVRTWDGAYAPRLRPDGHRPSAHAWGIAFDINAAWNPAGVDPAPLYAPGSVLELVPLATRLGFAWGGHASGTARRGLHFELAVLA